jgi:hypothetical protein
MLATLMRIQPNKNNLNLGRLKDDLMQTDKLVLFNYLRLSYKGTCNILYAQSGQRQNLNKRASIKDNNQDVSDFTEIYVGHL